ncbi:hypothetical protein ZHAS_00014041 [Anopheles sinensis]|uniref:Uncharacterized protein n=1 Tax=Anopheles sinensis TaxID=74873 RepID=A0A084W775_ANOSI|nr:hypothetical protein ZHAS_00014041 [Anopheles sinensis]
MNQPREATGTTTEGGKDRERSVETVAFANQRSGTTFLAHGMTMDRSSTSTSCILAMSWQHWIPSLHAQHAIVPLPSPSTSLPVVLGVVFGRAMAQKLLHHSRKLQETAQSDDPRRSDVKVFAMA